MYIYTNGAKAAWPNSSWMLRHTGGVWISDRKKLHRPAVGCGKPDGLGDESSPSRRKWRANCPRLTPAVSVWLLCRLAPVRYRRGHLHFPINSLVDTLVNKKIVYKKKIYSSSHTCWKASKYFFGEVSTSQRPTMGQFTERLNLAEENYSARLPFDKYYK